MKLVTIITHMENGLLYNNMQEMLECARMVGTPEADIIAENGYRHAISYFTIDECVNNIEKIYNGF